MSGTPATQIEMVAGAVAAGYGSILTNETFVPFIGVPLSVLLMSYCGALIAMCISDPIQPRLKMFGMVAASGFLGTAFVTAAPHVAGFGWTGDIQPAVLGMITGFFCRWLIPVFIDTLPAAVRSIIAKFNKEGK